jgi:8-oxo-dGTP pyrophosphatase MutT (NUDIX family)
MSHLRAEETEGGATDANRHYDEVHPHGKPMDAHSAIPHLPGAAEGRLVKVAAVAVLNASGQILVGLNKKRHVWDIPQGVVENGELPIETALRELEEETGIVARQEDLESMALFRHKTPEFVFPWETTLYIASVDDVSMAANREPHKCEALKWFAPVQLPVPRGLSLRILLNLLGRD